MIRWTGLAPWKFEFPFPGSLTSTFLRLTTLLCDRSSPHNLTVLQVTSPTDLKGMAERLAKAQFTKNRDPAECEPYTLHH